MEDSSQTMKTVLVSLALLHAVEVSAVDNTFTVVGLPDTQNYSEKYPEIFKAQTEWIVRVKTELDIRFVSHYGDLVQNGDQIDQWNNADAAIKVLDDAGVVYGALGGNHDVTASGIFGQPYIPQNYLNYFGPQRFSGKDWYGGTSPSGMSSFQYFDGGDRTFLALHIVVDTPFDELVWAQGVIDQHRELPVFMTTHRYVQDVDDYVPDFLEGITNLVVESGRYPDIWYTFEANYHPNGIYAEELWNVFIKTNKNIFMVNCGHFHEQYRLTSKNIFGNDVHELLADYQDDPNGGNGWLRIMEFHLDQNRIDVDSYSPTLDQFRTANQGKFSLVVNFDEYAYEYPTLSFRQGINGYSGTHDTWVSEHDKNKSFGGQATINVDDDVRNSWFSDREGQGLLKFENIFTSTGEAGKIPLGSTITKASLRFYFDDDIDHPFYNPEIRIYMMLRGWNEGSTWNSLGGGIRNDLGMFLGAVHGDNEPNGSELRFLDVTPALEAWAHGADNNGFAILSELIGGNDDGIEIRSSEWANPLYRPVLDVSFIPV